MPTLLGGKEACSWFPLILLLDLEKECTFSRMKQFLIWRNELAAHNYS